MKKQVCSSACDKPALPREQGLLAVPLSAILVAGRACFSVVFAAGFVLEAIRIIALAPSLGETKATAIDVPVMLLLAWVACA